MSDNNSQPVFINTSKEFYEIYRLIEHIPGWYGPPEAELLHRTAKILPDKCTIVEIGSWCGRSAIMLGLVAQKKRGQVWSVDAWSDATCPKDARLKPSEAFHRFEIERNRFRLDKTVNKIHAESTEAASIWAKKEQAIDMLHIDGGHLYEEAYADLTEWTPFVSRNGWVCLHDYNDIKKCGVRQATLDFFKNKPFSPAMEVPGVLGVWRRKG